MYHLAAKGFVVDTLSTVAQGKNDASFYKILTSLVRILFGSRFSIDNRTRHGGVSSVGVHASIELLKSVLK